MSESTSYRAYLQLLLGLVITFQGLALVITSNKLVATYWWMRLIGLAMAVGGLYFIYRYLPREVLSRPIDEEAKAQAARDLVMRLAAVRRPAPPSCPGAPYASPGTTGGGVRPWPSPCPPSRSR